MKRIIYISNNTSFRRSSISDLILGLIFVMIASSGLFLNSKLILKLVMYIIPFALLLYSLSIYKMAFNLKKTDKKHFIIFLIQAIFITFLAIYVIFYPLESLNYIIVLIGTLIMINSINRMIITNSKYLSFTPFLIGILLILFSNQIINTFYTLFLIILLFIGISKLINFFYKIKK